MLYQAAGTQRPSLCASNLAKMDDLMDIAVQEDDIKSVAATLFGGKILFLSFAIYD